MVTDALRYFREVDLFRGLTEDELEECKRSLPMFEANKGRLLLVPGRDEQLLYIVKRGSVRLYRLSHEGREVTLGEIAVGDVFGTLPMFGALSRNTYAVAATDALICKITEDRLAALIARHPAMATRLLRIVGERLASAEDQIEDLVFRTAEQRIAKQIVKMLEGANRSKLAVSHEEIARNAGVARETVTKMLNDLERQGVVKTGYRSLRILDHAPLEQRAAD
ncbi:MAG: Crp/Fnr family transcriptional regulator [Actinomycetota bacterium]